MPDISLILDLTPLIGKMKCQSRTPLEWPLHMPSKFRKKCFFFENVRPLVPSLQGWKKICLAYGGKVLYTRKWCLFPNNTASRISQPLRLYGRVASGMNSNKLARTTKQERDVCVCSVCVWIWHLIRPQNGVWRSVNKWD